MNGVVVAAWVALTAAGAAVATDCVTTENAAVNMDGDNVVYKNGDAFAYTKTHVEQECSSITYCENLCAIHQCEAYEFEQALAGNLCSCTVYTDLKPKAPFATLQDDGRTLVDCRNVIPLVQNRGACTVTAHQSYNDDTDEEGIANPAQYTNGWIIFLSQEATTVASCAETCIQTPDCSAFAFDTKEDSAGPSLCKLIRRSASAVLVPTVYIDVNSTAYKRKSTGDCGPLPAPKPSPPPPAVPPAPPPEAKKKLLWDWLGPTLALVFIILVYIVYIVYRKCEKNNKSVASMTDSML
jgi:hypothetical protein